MQHIAVPMLPLPQPPLFTTSPPSPPTPRAPRQRHRSSPPSMTLSRSHTPSHPLPSPVREYHNKISQHLLTLIRATPTLPTNKPQSSSNPSSTTSTRRSSSADIHSAPTSLSPVTTITETEEEEDKTSSIPTLPILATPPDFTARPITSTKGTCITSIPPRPPSSSLESREEEQKNAWATDGYRVYKAPVAFSLLLSERSRRGSATSSRVGMDLSPGARMGDGDGRASHSVSAVSMGGDTSMSMMAGSSMSMMAGSSISRSRLASQNMSRGDSGSTGDGEGRVLDVGDAGTREGVMLEKDEEYEVRRKLKFAKKQGQLRARVEEWYQGIVDVNPIGSETAPPEILPFLPSPSLLLTTIRTASITKPDIDLALRLSTLNALLDEKVMQIPQPKSKCTFAPKGPLKTVERARCLGEGLFEVVEPLIQPQIGSSVHITSDGMPTPRAEGNMVFPRR